MEFKEELVREFNNMCLTKKGKEPCDGCKYDYCPTVVHCAAEFMAEHFMLREKEYMSCEGCKHLHDGDDGSACRNCYRNYEEDFYEKES